MKLSEFIGKAKEAITGHWSKGYLHTFEGDHCLLGALEKAEGRHTQGSYPRFYSARMEEAVKLMREIIQSHTVWRSRAGSRMGKGAGIDSFNDNQYTTFEEIEALLTEAERRAKVLEGE